MKLTPLVAAALAAPVLLVPAAASAGGGSSGDAPARAGGMSKGTEVFRAHLEELNSSGSTGTVKLQLRGDQLTVRIRARGLTPGQVHAQHIHGIGNSECPTPAADVDRNGLVDVVEGVPFYGPIVTSLTTRGDTSPDTALDVELMPQADERGRIDYRRTFTVPAALAGNLAAFQVVQHGVDLNGNDTYDFGAGRSEIAPSLPLEATLPANCGTIEHAGHAHQH